MNPYVQKRINREVKAMAKKNKAAAAPIKREDIPANLLPLFDHVNGINEWLEQQKVSPSQGAMVRRAFEQFCQTADRVFAPTPEQKKADAKLKAVN
jgi:hypothetical protein